MGFGSGHKLKCYISHCHRGLPHSLEVTLPTPQQTQTLDIQNDQFQCRTPQLTAVKNVVDAWTSLNLGKANALISKNYQYELSLWERLVLIVSTKSSAVLTMDFFVLWELRR